MRQVLVGGALLVLAIAVGTAGVAARQHEGHAQAAQPAAADAKAAKPGEDQKKDPNRPKPENQPGAVMNAEELAASHADHHELQTYEGGGVLPAGWKNRFDLSNMKLENVRVLADGGTLHVTSGPPGIYYNPSMRASGVYTVKATFTLLTKGEHREGYGPFIGGADLAGDAQRYTYFLLRQDGKFLVKQRAGTDTKGVMDWTVHPAIKSFGADGKMSNDLAIMVGADTVRFLINGTEVLSKPRADVDTDGIVGLRVNHHLDLRVAGLTIAPASTTQ
jgi:hypothetical protein